MTSDLLAALDKAGIEVKPLEWPAYIQSLDVWSANGGLYWAWERVGLGYWRRWHPAHNESHCVDGDLEAAKAAAQADYLSRILSALQFKDQGNG